MFAYLKLLLWNMQKIKRTALRWKQFMQIRFVLPENAYDDSYNTLLFS